METTLPLTTIRRTLPLATPQRLTPTGKSGQTDEAPRAPRRGASPPTVALQIDGTSRGDLPVVTRGAAANAGYFCGPVPRGVCRLQAQGMSRGPALPGEMGGAGDDGSAGDRPPSDAAPRGPGWKLGAAACAAENQAQRATGATDAPCGAPARWSPRLGRTCTQASPSAATTGEWSWPNHPCPQRALANGHERSRAVNHGSCKSALTSQFGVGAGPSLALDSAFQARDPGATSGPHPTGRSRTTADTGGRPTQQFSPPFRS
jgi:hypothetical protein